MPPKLKLIIAVILLLCLFWQAAPANQAAAANIFSQCVTLSDGTKSCGPCDSSNGKSSTSTVCNEATNAQGSKQNPIVHTIRIVANIFALAAGVGAIIMIILGGLALIGSAGKSENVVLARRRILYAVVGLVVVALAWTIVQFITSHIQ